MDTNRIKRFAIEARNILKAGIAAKIITLGFDKKGQVAEENRPRLVQGGSLWNGQILTEGFYHQWMSLYNRIQQKGINEVYEEAAYTWFNRLCAIRILQKNNLCASVLDYANASRTPIIVDEARQGRMPEMDESMRSRLVELLDDDTRTTEQFAVLINAWCHANPIIQKCFGSIADYTELLLPYNILAEGGFMDMLHHTEFITDEDFQSPELIGWLYQFYISERKDEVFAKKGKFEADEIPAATQIFTPNWIVKYMVQNTVGRIYLENNPYETQLQKSWKYLVEPSEKASSNSVLRYEELTDLKVADLACGSGHILNECFDLLYDLYIAEGYSRSEAVENIFLHNLTGVDIDTRAKQLATFALMLKACQKDAAFADGHCMPKILDMAGVVPTMNEQELSKACLSFIGGYENVAAEMLEKDFGLLREADNLGSIMKFNDDENYLALLRNHYNDWADGGVENCPENVKALIPGVRLILTLTDKYHALVMNPPYMGGGNMNATLSKYVKDEYEEGKADLFSVFMLLAIDRLAANGKYGMINMQSWMFLSSFEKLRSRLLEENRIDNMLHLGPRTFDELSGEVVQNTAFVITNCEGKDATGAYYRLIEGKNCGDKERMFLEAQENDGKRIYYPNVSQQDFEKIPGCPIGYSISSKIANSFLHNKMDLYSKPSKGMMPGSDYLRLFWEVSCQQIETRVMNHTQSLTSPLKWYPYFKGGSFRRWYGNKIFVVDYQFDGVRVKSGDRNPAIYFKDNINWSKIASGLFSARKGEQGSLYDDAACQCYVHDNDNYKYLLGLLNSKYAQSILWCKSQTFNYVPSEIAQIPVVVDTNKKNSLDYLVQQNISISKQDWDAHETSWDFETNPLLAVDNDTYIDNINHETERHEKETGEHLCIDPAMPELDSMEWRMEQYKQKWEHLFIQLHYNEEELNRQFIDIYGLQDELTPDVPLDEITILQQGEISFAPCPGSDSMFGAAILWNENIVMKQFISYAIGCMMGRYRLDKPGLHIAHPEPSDEEVAPYEFEGNRFDIDEDGIIPLLPSDCGFSDNASNRFSDFLRIALGDSKHVENLNYVEKCLGKTLEQYFVKDFWKDHKKVYQNRPIYWLFASKKGAFQCITYMHRMNAYTVERIRSKYLLPYIENLQTRITDLEARRASLSTIENKGLQQLRKTLDECQEYHERLQVVAEQAISFDLDDGVVVNYAKFGDVVQKIK